MRNDEYICNYPIQTLRNAIKRAAIKIKTHVNKQQLRPRAIPKIDTHAHTHNRSCTEHAVARPAEKSIFWAKLLPLTPQCELDLRIAVDKRPIYLHKVNRIALYLYCDTVQFLLTWTRVISSKGFRMLLPSRSNQSDGSVAAAWRRASTPAGSLPCMHPAAGTLCRILDLSWHWLQGSTNFRFYCMTHQINIYLINISK